MKMSILLFFVCINLAAAQTTTEEAPAAISETSADQVAPAKTKRDVNLYLEFTTGNISADELSSGGITIQESGLRNSVFDDMDANGLNVGLRKSFRREQQIGFTVGGALKILTADFEYVDMVNVGIEAEATLDINVGDATFFAGPTLGYGASILTVDLGLVSADISGNYLSYGGKIGAQYAIGDRFVPFIKYSITKAQVQYDSENTTRSSGFTTFSVNVPAFDLDTTENILTFGAGILF